MRVLPMSVNFLNASGRHVYEQLSHTGDLEGVVS